MQTTDYAASALFEHRFWVQVMGDHARFIQDSLSPVEGQEIQRTRFYVAKFDELLNKSRMQLNDGEVNELSREAHSRTQDIRNFKLHLLRRHLTGKIGLKLPPSFLNHMVELEMLLFKGFLRELEEMGLTREMLGVFTPLMADHMAREECYYLTKLSLTGGTKPPECDPGKPRTEA